MIVCTQNNTHTYLEHISILTSSDIRTTIPGTGVPGIIIQEGARVTGIFTTYDYIIYLSISLYNMYETRRYTAALYGTFYDKICLGYLSTKIRRNKKRVRELYYTTRYCMNESLHAE